jgi:hypothetical protein
MASEGGGGANEHKPLGAVGVIYCKALGDEAACGMGGDDDCFKFQGVHECREIRREIMVAVPLRGVAGIPVPPLRQGEGADGCGQVM